MKDRDGRAIILQKLYELRDEKQWVTPKDLQTENETLGGVVLTRLMSQLAENGLIEWKPNLSRRTGRIDFYAARILSAGVEVIEGSRQPPIAINVDKGITLHGSHNVMIGGQENTPSVTMDLEQLNMIVDSSDSSQADKQAAKSIFKMLSESKLAQWAIGKLFRG
jgi:hypothetical protein